MVCVSAQADEVSVVLPDLVGSRLVEVAQSEGQTQHRRVKHLCLHSNKHFELVEQRRKSKVQREGTGAVFGARELWMVLRFDDLMLPLDVFALHVSQGLLKRGR